MAKGYELSQSSLTGVFDTGKFNCVSSSALYYLLGTRLGLRMDAILIPGEKNGVGHAAIDLLDRGKRVECEPTNKEGFDWPAKLRRPGVVATGPRPDRKKGKRGDGWALAASMYSNRSVAAFKADPPRHGESVASAAAALALSPADPSAVKNLRAAFVNGGPKLADAGRPAEGMRLLALGLTVAPGDPAVTNNYTVVTTRTILARLEAGKDREALALLRQARRLAPKREEFKDEARWFIRVGQQKVEKGQWAPALALVDRAVKVLSAEGAKALHQWRSSMYRQWSQSLLTKGDFDGSARVLARALAATPGDAELLRGVSYHTQEALEALAKKGPTAAVRHFRKLLSLFPKVDEVRAAGERHAGRATLRLLEEKKYREALAAVTAYQPMLKDGSEVAPAVHDRWARALAEEKKYAAALARYGEGLRAFPNAELLANNAVVVVNQWAKTAIERKDWKEAVRIYRVGLKHLPNNGALQRGLQFCAEQMQKA
jgi:tetratricopeptide (TPR) repeat protein